MSEHGRCRQWYCDPNRVNDPDLKAALLDEGPHCKECGHEWPCESYEESGEK